MDTIYEQLKGTLSFSTREKTDQILRYKEAKASVKKVRNMISIPLLLGSAYCALNLESYSSYLLPGLSSKSYSQFSLNLNLFILITCVTLFMYYNLISKRYNSMNLKFENFKENLIKCTSENFCNCNEHPNCDCKEKYLKWMKKENDINLIF